VIPCLQSWDASGRDETLSSAKVGAVFEELGFTYMGPVDGHNLEELIATFQQACTSARFSNCVKGRTGSQRERPSGLPCSITLHLPLGHPLVNPAPDSKSLLTRWSNLQIQNYWHYCAMATGTGLDKLQVAANNISMLALLSNTRSLL